MSVVKLNLPQSVKPNFRVVTLAEPPKHELAPFLESEARKQISVPCPERKARVQVVIESSKGVNQLLEFHVSLANEAVTYKAHLKGRHSYIDSHYMKDVEKACLADDRVQEEIRSLDLPSTATVVVEPWAYATDGLNDMSERTTMVSVPS